MSGIPRLRAAISDLPSYQAGARPQANAGRVARLASNELAYAPLPSVVRALEAAGSGVNRYPDPAAAELVAAIAGRHRVPAEQVAVGPGSVALGEQLVQITADPRDDVLFAWRSFEAYPIFAALAEARPVTVPLAAGGGHDVEAMAAAVTSRTRIVFLCSPNNPTGPVMSHAGAEQFCDAVPGEVLIVVDEAYREFITAPGALDGLTLARTRPNVCVLRTFSKAYGLAGLRVGYVIGPASVVAALRAIATPFAVSSVAQAAAVASLQAQQELQARVAAVIRERDRVSAALQAAGWQIPDAQGNFVWLPAGGRSAQLEQAARQSGILVRAYGGEGVRVTVGHPDDNDRFLAVAAAVAAAREA